MSRIEPLFKVDTFRSSVLYLLDLPQERVQQFMAESIAELSLTTHVQPRSDDELAKRALGIMYEAAVRDGIEEVEQELRAAFPDDASRLGRLVDTITPAHDSMARLRSIEARDAFVPVLVGHRFALDLRVTEALDGSSVATPLVTTRFDFDAVIGSGSDAVVFQINLSELAELEKALGDIRNRAQKLVSDDMRIVDGWGENVFSE